MAKTITEALPQPGSVAAEAAQQATSFSTTGDMIKARMPNLVKGVGYAGEGGNTPISDQADITTRGAEAAFAVRKATWQGKNQRAEVVKSLNPGFLSQFGNLATALSQPSIGEQLQQFMGAVASPDVMRSFTAGNLGIGSVYGNTPFNLLAPSRLIYPVYTVYRNKFPRPAGQGASLIERLFTGISGSQTGAQGVLDVAIPELVSTGGSFSTWPLNLPPAGSQTEVTLNLWGHLAAT